MYPIRNRSLNRSVRLNKEKIYLVKDLNESQLSLVTSATKLLCILKNGMYLFTDENNRWDIGYNYKAKSKSTIIWVINPKCFSTIKDKVIDYVQF